MSDFETQNFVCSEHSWAELFYGLQFGLFYQNCLTNTATGQGVAVIALHCHCLYLNEFHLNIC